MQRWTLDGSPCRESSSLRTEGMTRAQTARGAQTAVYRTEFFGSSILAERNAISSCSALCRLDQK
eukprot:scaffold164178_cov32-Tisochrysis_lutea.AAC.3